MNTGGSEKMNRKRKRELNVPTFSETFNPSPEDNNMRYLEYVNQYPTGHFQETFGRFENEEPPSKKRRLNDPNSSFYPNGSNGSSSTMNYHSVFGMSPLIYQHQAIQHNPFSMYSNSLGGLMGMGPQMMYQHSIRPIERSSPSMTMSSSSIARIQQRNEKVSLPSISNAVSIPSNQNPQLYTHNQNDPNIVRMMKQTTEELNERKCVSEMGIIRLKHGFNHKLKTKVLGGKQNRTPISNQTVEIDLEKLRRQFSWEEIVRFRVMALLYGYKKSNLNHVDEEQLTVLERRTIPHSYFSRPSIEICFKELVIKYSSHNHGQRLFLRFVIMKNEKEELYSCDSKDFQTITRRGIEKQKGKKRHTEKFLMKNGNIFSSFLSSKFRTTIGPSTTSTTSTSTTSTTSDSSSSSSDKSERFNLNLPVSSSISAVSPSVGVGGQLVMVNGIFPIARVKKLEDIKVKFGEVSCECVYSISTICIICRTPTSFPSYAKVHINVSLDGGKTFSTSTEKVFEFVNPNDPIHQQRLIQNIGWKKSSSSLTSVPTTTSSSLTSMPITSSSSLSSMPTTSSSSSTSAPTTSSSSSTSAPTTTTASSLTATTTSSSSSSKIALPPSSVKTRRQERRQEQ